MIENLEKVNRDVVTVFRLNIRLRLMRYNYIKQTWIFKEVNYDHQY